MCLLCVLSLRLDLGAVYCLPTARLHNVINRQDTLSVHQNAASVCCSLRYACNPAEAKLAREKREAHYPTPEEPKTCIVCRQLTATISCMECPNKVCQACVTRECLEKEKSFLYFHHQHCLRYGTAVMGRMKSGPLVRLYGAETNPLMHDIPVGWLVKRSGRRKGRVHCVGQVHWMLVTHSFQWRS